MQQFKLLPINNIVESVYYKHIYNPKHIKYKSLYSPKRNKVKGKLSDDDITMIKYLCIFMKEYKIRKKDIAKYYNVSQPVVSNISSGELFDKHIAYFEITINGGSYKVIDNNKLNIWKSRNKIDIEGVLADIKHIK